MYPEQLAHSAPGREMLSLSTMREGADHREILQQRDSLFEYRYRNIDEHEVIEKLWGWSAGKKSTSYQRVIKPHFPPFKLRKLPKFTAVIATARNHSASG